MCASPVVLVLFLIMSMVLMVFEHSNGRWFTSSNGLTAGLIAAGIGYVVTFWLLSRFCLTSAQNWIARHDRIRYGEDGPPRLLSSRRRRPNDERS
jgi:hypothetical protein